MTDLLYKGPIVFRLDIWHQETCAKTWELILVSASSNKARPQLDPQTFGSTMGNAVWLMTMDKRYRDRPIREIEAIVAAPLLPRQFKLYSKGKQPVAFLTWASVSEEVKAKLAAGEALALEDWRSGDNLEVVDCVSPFTEAAKVREKFLAGVK